MSNSVTVQEDIHKIWKTGSIISGLLCVIFFLIYWNINEPFWSGIFRLGAFIFFAIAMLGGLKLMGSSLQVTLSSTEELLLITYQKKGKVIQEEQFKKETIKEVIPVKPRGNIFYTYLQPSSRTFKINFTDTDRDLHLFEFGGRPLLFDPSSQRTIENFLKDLGVDS